MAGKRVVGDVSRLASKEKPPTSREWAAIQRELEQEKQIRKALAEENSRLKAKPEKPKLVLRDQFLSTTLGGRGDPCPQGFIHLQEEEDGYVWAYIPVRLNLTVYRFQQRKFKDTRTGELRTMNNYVIGETKVRRTEDTVLFQFPGRKPQEFSLNCYAIVTLDPAAMDTIMEQNERGQIIQAASKIDPEEDDPSKENPEDTDDISRTGNFTPSEQSSNGPEIQRNPNLEPRSPHSQGRSTKAQQLGGLDPGPRTNPHVKYSFPIEINHESPG